MITNILFKKNIFFFSFFVNQKDNIWQIIDNKTKIFTLFCGIGEKEKKMLTLPSKVVLFLGNNHQIYIKKEGNFYNHCLKKFWEKKWK